MIKKHSSHIEGYAFRGFSIPRDFKINIPEIYPTRSPKEMIDDFISRISETKYPVSLDEDLLGEQVIRVSPKIYNSIENEMIYGRYKGFLIDFNSFLPDNYIFSN